MERHLEKGKEG